MKLSEIIEFLNKEVPQDLALSDDNIGLMGHYDLTEEISSIKIFMDLYPQDDNYESNTLIITHHPPLFIPKTPTFTIHSNWDIIKGGANEALADCLNLKVIESFDKNTDIGRICDANLSYKDLKKNILNKFNEFTIVNKPNEDKIIKKIAIISGFGLKNPEYIKLAKKSNLDMIISGDVIQETAIMAINLDLTLIDLGHHNSEVPGLEHLKNIIGKLDVNCEIINKLPMESERNEH
ncbi:Nif3-like dinuclear metal center hexameric protein [Methanobrevibacter sp.]|uniref:Nif3-like dinuclear metal center hexameric protein n=1 Tax=Methanobrevibacter sp. TaxID=66852 RepID=UPI00388F089F